MCPSNESQRPSPSARARRSRCLAALLLGCASLIQLPAFAQGPPMAPKTRIRQSVLEGRWQRTDGGYILEIRGVSSDGKLEAAYLNPRPIHVARAEWGQKDGQLGLFVELRDTNYPGSIYTLLLSADGRHLKGNYFQAEQKVDYAVEFVRLATQDKGH